MKIISYPEAQFPLATPPLVEHSLAVKQVPFRFDLQTTTTTTNQIKFIFWIAKFLHVLTH
jgi:hypothetical protein